MKNDERHGRMRQVRARNTVIGRALEGPEDRLDVRRPPFLQEIGERNS